MRHRDLRRQRAKVLAASWAVDVPRRRLFRRRALFWCVTFRDVVVEQVFYALPRRQGPRKCVRVSGFIGMCWGWAAARQPQCRETRVRRQAKERLRGQSVKREEGRPELITNGVPARPVVESLGSVSSFLVVLDDDWAHSVQGHTGLFAESEQGHALLQLHHVRSRPWRQVLARIGDGSVHLSLPTELDKFLQSQRELEIVLKKKSARPLKKIRNLMPTLVFFSVPLFSPHHASASATDCFSTKAVSIRTSSAKSFISTSC